MSQMSSVKAGRALENRAHVRMLLGLRQPAFAAALASAGQDFSCSACSGRRPERDKDRAPVSSSCLLVRQQRPHTGPNSARVRWTEAPAAPLPGGSVIRTAEPPEPTLDCTSDRFRHPAHTKRHGPNHRRWLPGCSTLFDRTMSQNWVFCLRYTRYQARLPPAPSRR
jgi:hypothetical protein